MPEEDDCAVFSLCMLLSVSQMVGWIILAPVCAIHGMYRLIITLGTLLTVSVAVFENRTGLLLVVGSAHCNLNIQTLSF